MLTTKAFCVGQAKSGTASLHGLLSARYRSAHEPERAQTLELILKESSGDIAEGAVRNYLLERDQRLNLDYDIAWANQFLIGHFLEVFPNAKFVVLVRDPFTWLQSVVGHLIGRNVPPDVRAFLNFWFKPEKYPPTRHDARLQDLGLYSVAAFLSAWNQHIDLCIRLIPAERRLILRTHELNESHGRLAEFLEIPSESLDARKRHQNQGVWSGGLESLVERTYVNEIVKATCGENMTRYFPKAADTEGSSL